MAGTGQDGGPRVVDARQTQSERRRATRRAALRRAGSVGLAGLAGLPALALLSACGTAQTAAPAASQGPVSLDFFLSSNSGEAPVRDQMVKTFEASHPTITLQVTPIGGSDDTETKVVTAAAAGTMPDVFFDHQANVGTFGHKKLTHELDSLATRKTKDFDLQDFLVPALDHFRWEGKLHALPQLWSPNPYYYSKAVIQKAGLPDPALLEKQGQWTLSKFEEYLKALSRPDTNPPVYGTQEVPIDLKIQIPYLWYFGGDAFSKDFKEAVFNAPAALQGWEALTRQRTNNWTLSGGGLELVGDGKVAFAYLPRVQVPKIAKITDGPGFGVVSMPVMPNGKQVTRSATAGYGIAAVTKKPDAAWLLCQHMGTVANDLQVSSFGTTPNRRSGWKSEVWLKSMLPWEDAAVYQRISDQVRPLINPPGMVQVIKLTGEAYNQVVKGQANVKTAFDEVKRLADQALREFGG